MIQSFNVHPKTDVGCNELIIQTYLRSSVCTTAHENSHQYCANYERRYIISC